MLHVYISIISGMDILLDSKDVGITLLLYLTCCKLIVVHWTLYNILL